MAIKKKDIIETTEPDWYSIAIVCLILALLGVLHHWWWSGWTDPFDWQALWHHEPLIMIVLAFGPGVLVSPET